jgi:hypothetical protein
MLGLNVPPVRSACKAAAGWVRAVADLPCSTLLMMYDCCALHHAGGEAMELQEFYEHMEQHRAAVVESAIQRYRSLTPLLGKVRGKVKQEVPLKVLNQ